MKRMIKYNDIKDLSAAVRNLKKQVQFTGEYDDEGNPIMNRLAVAPKLMVTFSEKIHGTNAGVCYSNPDGFWVQSRERILERDLASDNAACAYHAYGNEKVWINIIKSLANEHNIDLDENIISVYYEWCGGSIQKKSAVSGLDKRSIIFQHFKVSPLEPLRDKNGDVIRTDEQPARWLPTYTIADMYGNGPNEIMWIDRSDKDIYNIMDFEVWQHEVHFEHADLSKNKLIELVTEIEKNSPVGEAMGIPNNIGEGIVGTFEYDDVVHKFKVKGTAHTNSRVKTLKPVDNEKEQRKIDLANKVTTAGRCEQGWQMIHGIDNEKCEPQKENLGDFLRWIHGDIMKECLPDYHEAGIEPKEINGLISKIARTWFLEELDKQLF